MVEKAVDGLRRHWRTGARCLAPEDPVAPKQSGDIGQCIPPDSETTEIDHERIEFGKDDAAGHVQVSKVVIGSDAAERGCCAVRHLRHV